MASPPRSAPGEAIGDVQQETGSDAGAPKALWEWVVDALAEELAAQGDATRETIVQSLIARAGYDMADSIFDPERGLRDARAELVYRLVGRLAESRRS